MPANVKNNIALEGIWRLKSVKLWTRIENIAPVHASRMPLCSGESIETKRRTQRITTKKEGPENRSQRQPPLRGGFQIVVVRVVEQHVEPKRLVFAVPVLEVSGSNSGRICTNHPKRIPIDDYAPSQHGIRAN